MAISSCWRCTPHSSSGRHLAAVRPPRYPWPPSYWRPSASSAISCLCATSCADQCWRRSSGTFGLALLLRYSAFWYFGANFKTLPDDMLGAPFVVGSIRIDAPRLLAGTVGLLVTLMLHLLLTRTQLGSRMLAVSEDATAAQLMGIRPERMQAVAWALAAGATGIAGALIATFFYTSPTVGETLAIVAFVTVAFGGFGSVPGALVAGLLIGVIEGLSAFLIGPVYKDVVVYLLFVLVL